MTQFAPSAAGCNHRILDCDGKFRRAERDTAFVCHQPHQPRRTRSSNLQPSICNQPPIKLSKNNLRRACPAIAAHAEACQPPRSRQCGMPAARHHQMTPPPYPLRLNLSTSNIHTRKRPGNSCRPGSAPVGGICRAATDSACAAGTLRIQSPDRTQVALCSAHAAAVVHQPPYPIIASAKQRPNPLLVGQRCPSAPTKTQNPRLECSNNNRTTQTQLPVLLSWGERKQVRASVKTNFFHPPRDPPKRVPLTPNA